VHHISVFDTGLFAAIILLAYTAQALTGFGSTVLTVTLAALFLPIPFIMPIAVVLNLPFGAWMMWREWNQISWPILRREILPLMTIGAIVGVLCATALTGINLKRPLGAIIMVLAALELQRLYARVEYRPPAPLRRGLMLASGFMQGLYATGGPLLASAMAGSGLHRTQRRATMMVVWMLLNTAMTLHYLLSARFTPDIVQLSLWLLPMTAIGLWVGQVLHERINENQFRLLVNLLLLVSGAGLLR
jgi:uncharacterized membrane protein YfcA